MKSVFTPGITFFLLIMLYLASYNSANGFSGNTQYSESAGSSVADSTRTDSLSERRNISAVAHELASDLADRIRLTDEETAEIAQILEDYQFRILEEKSDSVDTGKERLENKEEVTGSSHEVLEKFKELDESVSQQISSVLSSRKKDEYSAIRDEWWTKVRDKVYEKEENKTEKPAVNDDLNRDELDSLPPPPNKTQKDSSNIR